MSDPTSPRWVGSAVTIIVGTFLFGFVTGMLVNIVCGVG